MTLKQKKNWILTGWHDKGCENPQVLFKKNESTLNAMLGQFERTKGGRKHWQCYVQFKERVRCKAVLAIFPSGQWRNSPAKGTAIQNRVYCSKSDSKLLWDGEDSYFECGTISLRGKIKELDEIKQMIDDGAGLRDLWVAHWACMVRHHRGIKEGIAVLSLAKDVALYKMIDFPTWPKRSDLDWSKSIILWGETGIGKTQYALALFKNPLMVSHKDHLGFYERSQHDGIVFDDMNFVGSPDDQKGRMFREAQIHLVDQDNNRQIHIRYLTANLPAHTPKVFTTNKVDGWIFDLDDPAIERRLDVHELKKFKFKT